jgi:RNA polymerase sigma-70 factor (ECF subfamily)
MADERSPSDTGSAGLGADASSTVVLLERVRRGDRDALEILFTRHAPGLRRWASRRLPAWARDITDTDDLVQGALLQTFRRIDTIDAEGSGALSAYLRQAVLNSVRDELRRKGRRPELENLDDQPILGGQSPLEAAIGREALDRYERALSRLKPDDQEAIVARLEMGHSYAEIGASLGRTPDAVRKLVQRALVRLAAEMDRLESA